MKNRTNIVFVKCRPPLEVCSCRTPVSESPRYNWEPLVLKYLAWILSVNFGESVVTSVWHLAEPDNDELFLAFVRENTPDIVMFTDLDIYISHINEMCARIRQVHPGVRIVVGGKQSSLLDVGDRSPFPFADCVVSGDGARAVVRIVDAVRACVPIDRIGIVFENGKVTDVQKFERDGEFGIDPGHRNIPVINYTMDEYIESYQSFPSIVAGKVRTVPVIIGTGCPYRCVFCQSPLDFGTSGAVSLVRPAEEVAAEITSLVERWSVNNVFSLESNLDLDNLDRIYAELDRKGIAQLSFSGFLRVTDVLPAHKSGVLARLRDRGMRVLSVGIDIPLNVKIDEYRKMYSYEQMMMSLELCRKYGILLLGTYVGNPDATREEFEAQLSTLGALPVADIDVRLAMALRNTEYYKCVESYLVIHPESDDPTRFDRQNYRYQTILFPGKITPRETYESIRHFKKWFLKTRHHLNYVKEMLDTFPDTKPFFIRQYDVADTGDIFREYGR